MNPVRDFCRERMLSKGLEEAFVQYCKTYLAKTYGIRMFDTLSLVGDKINRKEIDDLWNRFIMDMRDALSQEKVA